VRFKLRAAAAESILCSSCTKGAVQGGPRSTKEHSRTASPEQADAPAGACVHQRYAKLAEASLLEERDRALRFTAKAMPAGGAGRQFDDSRCPRHFSWPRLPGPKRRAGGARPSSSPARRGRPRWSAPRNQNEETQLEENPPAPYGLRATSPAAYQLGRRRTRRRPAWRDSVDAPPPFPGPAEIVSDGTRTPTTAAEWT